MSNNTIEQYRQAKHDYLRLRNQAKKELVARFQQVANELFQIQRELLEDFGEKIAIPTKPKKGRASRPVKQTPARTSAASAPPSAPSAQVVALQKQLERAKKKLADTQAAGKPAKAAEDRIYELEDALRLAQNK